MEIILTMKFSSLAELNAFLSNSTASPISVPVSSPPGLTVSVTPSTANPPPFISPATVALPPGATPLPSSEDEDEPAGTPPATISPTEFDARGFPWNEQIHSSAKTKTKGNTWRALKGVTPATVASVEAQLSAVGWGAALVAGKPPAPAVSPPTAAVPIPVQPIAPPPVQAQPIPATPPPAAAAGERNASNDFGMFMQVIAQAMATGKIGQDGAYMAEMSAYCGVAGIGALNGNPALIAHAYNKLVADQKL